MSIIIGGPWHAPEEIIPPAGVGYPDTYFTPNYQQLTFSDVSGSNDTAASWFTFDQSRRDSVIGPGCYYSAPNFRIVWTNPGGDWYDATGSAQGNTPFGTVSVPFNNTAVQNCNITSLVNGWCTGAWPNYGLMVIGANAALTLSFHSRFNADPNLRPFLTISGPTLAQTVVPCGRSQWIVTTQYAGSGLAEQDTLKLANTSRSLLWFDLQAYTGHTITSAVVSFYPFSWFGSGWPLTVQFFRLWNPADQTNIPDQTIGLAGAYPLDAGIESHPDVMFVQKFTDANYMSLWYGPVDARTGALVTAPDGNGFTRLLDTFNGWKQTMPIGINSGASAWWSPWNPNVPYTRLKPAQDMEEAYVRYYFMLGNDWNPQPNPAGKLNGIDSRYIGIPTNPIVGMGSGNTGNIADGICGFSARGSYDAVPPSKDPLTGLSGIGNSGDYNADADENGSQVWFWPNYYLTTMEIGKWMCIEYRILLNTVTAPQEVPRLLASLTSSGTTATAVFVNPETSPLYFTGATWSMGGAASDSLTYNNNHVITVVNSTTFTYTVAAGSFSPPHFGTTWGKFYAVPGTGNKDGILQMWINGRLAGTYGNVRWRNCRFRPDGGVYAIDNFWFLIYNGGAASPTVASSAYQAAIVVSKSYIGPMVQSRALPAWLQGNAINQWIEIPGTGMDKMDYTSQIAAGLTTSAIGNGGRGGIYYGDPVFGIVQSDSGGGFKSSNSTLICFGGGGDGGWAGNDIRGLCLEDDAPVWVTLKKPSDVSLVWNTGYYGQQVADPTALYLRNGTTPGSGHSYNQHHFVNAQNKFYRMGYQQCWQTDTIGAPDLQRVDAVTLDGDDADDWDAPGTHPLNPFQSSGGWSAWVGKSHPYTDDYFCIIHKNSRAWLCKYTWAANGGTGAWSNLSQPVVSGVDPERGSSAIDPRGTGDGHMLVIQTMTSGGATTCQWYDLDTGAVQVATLADTVPGSGYSTKIVSGPGFWAAGLVFDLVNNIFVMCVDDGYLYTLTQVGTSPAFNVDRMVLTGTPMPPLSCSRTSGIPGTVSIYGHMRYVPNLKGISIFPSQWAKASGKSINCYFVKTSA